MKITVNYSACAATGACARVAPELFEVRDGNLYVLNDSPTGDLEMKARVAEELCPTGAITLED